EPLSRFQAGRHRIGRLRRPGGVQPELTHPCSITRRADSCQRRQRQRQDRSLARTFASITMSSPKTSDRPSKEVKDTREDWTFEELQAEADELRTRLQKFRTSLGRFFINKQELIDLMVVAAVAQEPLLLVGPPGTAKSDLVLKFKDALGLGEGDYFEYMLTRF